jgi:phosphoglycerate dehydrogenase-like enzyme
MSKPKVLIEPHFRSLDSVFAPEQLERLRSFADVIWARDGAMPAEEYNAIRGDVAAIVSGGWRQGDVKDWPKLRAIMEVGGRHPSPDALDYEHCFARSIRVLSCAPAYGPSVAELALGLALAAGRQLTDGHVAMTQGHEVWGGAANLTAISLYDQPVGLVGFGGLARCLMPLLAPFRCDFFAHDPWLSDSYISQRGATPIGLDELLETCRFIFVLAIPSTENRAMIDRVRLERITADSVFLLISRAHVVDFDALTELLIAGRFRAGVDVYPKEPLAADHPIRTAPNVVLSAHKAGGTPRALRDIGRMVVDDLEAILNGLPPTEMQVAHPEIVRRLP